MKWYLRKFPFRGLVASGGNYVSRHSLVIQVRQPGYNLSSGQKNNEPKDWILSEQYDVEYEGGKCALWGFPYSSMPILFDNIEIRSN